MPIVDPPSPPPPPPPPDTSPQSRTTITTPYSPAPYLTIAEFRQAKTGLDTSDLVPGGQAALEDAELANVILRASSWMDTLCNQILSATVDTDNGILRPSRDGDIVVATDYSPVLEVRDFRFGTTPKNMRALADLSGIWIERTFFRVVSPSWLSSSIGPLQFGSPMPSQPLYCRWTYVNGWPNTVLAFPAAAGGVVFNVVDPTGIYGALGTRLWIYDGAATEQVTVQSVNGSAITLGTPLVFSHTPRAANPISVSALPPSIKQAAILVTSALIKAPGDAAIVLDSIHSGGPSKIQGSEVDEFADLVMADELLSDFRRAY